MQEKYLQEQYRFFNLIKTQDRLIKISIAYMIAHYSLVKLGAVYGQQVISMICFMIWSAKQLLFCM